jgi:hypothetical protein
MTPGANAPHRTHVNSALAFKCFLVGFDNKVRFQQCMAGK